MPRAKLGIGNYRYALLNILIESNFVMINRRIFVTKITVSILFQTVEQLMSYIEKCVLLTGGLEVSFSIYISIICISLK